MNEQEPAREAHESTGHPSASQPLCNRVTACYRRHRAATLLCALLAVLLVAVGTDLAVLLSRTERYPLAAPAQSGPAPETWLIVGTDSREDVPEGPGLPFGTVEEAGEGKRADVLALLQTRGSKVTVLLLPRDLIIGPSLFEEERLATSFLVGPQNTADLLCGSLGVPVHHLVTVSMAQFASIVDSLGGIDIDVAEPVQDVMAGLSLPQAGRVHLDGVTALALVRSRHPQVLRDGTWVTLSEAEGAHRRTLSSGLVMREVMHRLRERTRSPLAARSLAHTVAGNTGLDQDTGLPDLLGLARAVTGAEQIDVVDVPAQVVNDTFVAPPTAETYRVLEEHGYQQGACTPAGG